MKRLLLLPALLLLLSACTDLPLPAPTDGKLSIVGELTGSDTVFLRAGKSLGFQGTGAIPELLQNLQITLRDSSSGFMIPLRKREDFATSYLYTLAFTAPASLTPDRRYTVTAKDLLLGEATATVYIPSAFSATLAGTAFTDYSRDSVLRFDIDINDPRAAEAFYVLEVVRQQVAISGYFFLNGSQYSLPEYRYKLDSLRNAGVPTNEHYDTTYPGGFTRQAAYTTDLLSDNSGRTISADGLYQRIFLSGRTFGGTAHRTQILVPRRFIYGEGSLYTQTVVRVKSVAPDYYIFLKAYDQYNPYSGLEGNTGPVNLPGNVKGGFGMIGGVYRQEIKVVY